MILTDATQSVPSAARAGDVATEGKTLRIRQTSSDITAQSPASSVVTDNSLEQAENCP